MSAVLAAIVLKGSLLMIAAAVTVALMFRASAATRHFIWTLTIAGLLMLPVMSMTLPAWEIALRIAPVETRAAMDAIQSIGTTRLVPARVAPDVDSDVRVDNLSSRRSSLPWLALLVPIYALVGLMLLARVAVQRSMAHRIVRESTALTDGEWTARLEECAARIGVTRPVALLRSRVQLMPITTGTLTTSIVVPAGADAWDSDRRRAVLLHELAHIARRDCLTQMLS